jgi:DNA-binding NarL/FixJ family response regulator
MVGVRSPSEHLGDMGLQAICDRLFLAPKTVEAHIANIFSKLELLPAPADHRWVLAVLAHLRG